MRARIVGLIHIGVKRHFLRRLLRSAKPLGNQPLHEVRSRPHVGLDALLSAFADWANFSIRCCCDNRIIPAHSMNKIGGRTWLAWQVRFSHSERSLYDMSSVDSKRCKGPPLLRR